MTLAIAGNGYLGLSSAMLLAQCNEVVAVVGGILICYTVLIPTIAY